MISEDEFISKVKEDVSPILEKHDPFRKKLLRKMHFDLFFAACVDILRLTLRTTVAVKPATIKVIERYSLLYKEKVYAEIMGKTLALLGDLSIQNEKMDENILNDSLLFNVYGNEREDYIAGTYKGKPLSIQECKSESFKGVAILMQIDKNFSGHTNVIEDSLANRFSSPVGLEKAPLECVVFEKKFDVYTNDQIEARYILTPVFMERLVALGKFSKRDKSGEVEKVSDPEKSSGFMSWDSLEKFAGIDKQRHVEAFDEKNVEELNKLPFFSRFITILNLTNSISVWGVEAAFFNNQLLIGVNTTQNFFEPVSINEKLNVHYFRKLYQEIQSIYNIYDTINESKK